MLPPPYPGNPTANKGYGWTKRQWLGWEEEPGLLLHPSTFLLPNPSHLPKVVANLFFGHAQVMARQRSLIRRSSTRTRRYKAPTVAARFQQSLLDLVEKMERSGQAGALGWWEQGDHGPSLRWLGRLCPLFSVANAVSSMQVQPLLRALSQTQQQEGESSVRPSLSMVMPMLWWAHRGFPNGH